MLAIAAAVALSCLPLLTHEALPRGSDVYSTNHYLQGFMKAFGEGDLYPRWTDRTNQNLGAPSFIMLMPLPYAGAGLATLVTGSPIAGLKLYLVVVSILTGVAFYLMARDWVGPGLAAGIASAIYLLLPYHVLDLYHRFALSETTAFIFFPLVLLFLRRLADRPGVTTLICAAASYAALVYTHLISAFMMGLFLIAWLPFHCRLSPGKLAGPLLALVCGVGLAAPALLPAVVEKRSANIDWVKEMPNGDFRINFIFSNEPLPGLGFKDPVKPPVLRGAHAQLALAGVAVIAALLGAARMSPRRREIAGLAGASLATYLLQTPVSTPIWVAVPNLATIQFPWRFQAIQVVCAALLVALALSPPAAARGGPRRPIIALWALAAMGALNLALAWQNAYLKPYDFTSAEISTPGVEGWIEPAFTPVEFRAYRRFRQTRLSVPQAEFTTGEGEVAVEEWTSTGRKMSVSSEGGGTVTVGSFWFPGWKAGLDGQSIPIEPSAELGLQTVSVPPGAHTLAFHFDATPVRRAAMWVGLLFVAATPALGFMMRTLRVMLTRRAATQEGT